MSNEPRIQERCQELSERFLAGDLRALERATFLAHARTCEACADIVAADAELRSAPVDCLTVLEGGSVRAAVLRELRREAGTGDLAGRGPRTGPAGLRNSWLPLAAAAVVLLAAGIWTGRAWAPSGDAAGDADTSFASRLQTAALDRRTLADLENSPYQFTNVTFRPAGSEQVAVGFDVTTHVELTAGKSDPLVRELVVQAMLNPSPIGARLTAIGYAEGVQNSEVLKALRIAVLNDPNVAVRLRALEALAPFKQDPEVQSTLLMVLTTSDSVPMRLQAIEHLIEGRVDKQAMRDALSTLDPAKNRPALIKASDYLN